MKLRDLERHLRDHGCRQIDEGGNHTRWAGPQGARSVVPRHREIDYGLARKICRQLEVPVAFWVTLNHLTTSVTLRQRTQGGCDRLQLLGVDCAWQIHQHRQPAADANQFLPSRESTHARCLIHRTSDVLVYPTRTAIYFERIYEEI